MLTKTIEVHEAQTRLDELIAWVASGAQVILTKGDTYVARLVQVSDLPRQAGLHAGAIWTSDDFDKPLPDEFWAGEA